MSQSPTAAVKIQRYEDGWNAIQRMIREDESWSGWERNCVHLARGDGKFTDASAVSGADYATDGRAFAVLDVDRDGRPDLALRNRNAPTLRIVQNVWPNPGRCVWLHLEGSTGNRGAIGAVVEVRAGKDRRVIPMTAGSRFLSQSSRWLPIGLGDAPGEVAIAVRWPGGRTQELGELQPGHRYWIREGERPRGEELSARREYASIEPSDAPRKTGVGTWLIERIPAPDFELKRVGKSEMLNLRGLRGAPVLLHILSPTCAVCVAAAPEHRRIEKIATDAGAQLVHAIVARNDQDAEAERIRFVEGAGYEAPAVAADDAFVAAYNVLHREIWNRRHDLAVPTTIWIDPGGYVVRVDRGALDPDAARAILAQFPRSPKELRTLAIGDASGPLVYPEAFRRNFAALGNAYREAGFPELARSAFAEDAARSPKSSNARFNLAVVAAERGDTAAAERIYREVIESGEYSGDARNNLAVLLAQRGETDAALRLLVDLVAGNPAHGEAPLNLAGIHLRSGRAEEAVKVLESAVRTDPESARFRRQLAYARYSLGDVHGAEQDYRRAIELDPLASESYRDLTALIFAQGREREAAELARRGIAVAGETAALRNALALAEIAIGRTEDGLNGLRRAIELDPKLVPAYVNLIAHLDDLGRESEATENLERLRTISPEAAARVRRRLRESGK